MLKSLKIRSLWSLLALYLFEIISDEDSKMVKEYEEKESLVPAGRIFHTQASQLNLL